MGNAGGSTSQLGVGVHQTTQEYAGFKYFGSCTGVDGAEYARCVGEVAVPAGSRLVVPMTLSGKSRDLRANALVAKKIWPIEAPWVGCTVGEPPLYDGLYTVGTIRHEPDLDENTWRQCEPGLHFCATLEDLHEELRASQPDWVPQWYHRACGLQPGDFF